VVAVSRPFTDNSVKILEKRYLLKDETGEPAEDIEGLFTRVARAIAEVEYKYGATESQVRDLEKSFFDLMWASDFMPNSPTLMNAGTGQGTLSACYVMDIPDSMGDIMRVAGDQAMIEKFGGGIGFSLSGIRPKGHGISTTHGKACGPIHVLRVLSQVGTMITQGGKRDGAHMAIMEVYHPDIEEFIHCKNIEGEVSNFNISIGADSTFMTAMQQDKWIHLSWPLDRASYDEPQDDGRYIRARELFEEIIRGAWTNGEPGMVWLDRINEDNSTPELGQINATNPCGEQPLLSGESCNLGSINVGNFIRDDKFDFKRFEKTVGISVNFLDNVVDANRHPTEFTQHMNESTRKVGLGIMGWANLLVRLNISYGSDEALKLADGVGASLKRVADETSSKIAEHKGSFPAFAGSTLNKANGGEWESMRNAWRLSIAPTGTISMIANCSSGIEPHFALAYKKHNLSAALEDVELFYVDQDLQKRLNMSEEELTDKLSSGVGIESLMDSEARKVFTVSDAIPYEWHVGTQAAFQKYVDSGISKTINLPNDATQHDIGLAYEKAWELGCKGITVYRQGSREKEVLTSLVPTTNGHSPSLSTWNIMGDLNSSERVGKTRTVPTGHGSLHVTVNDVDGRPIEVFATVGKAGACEAATTEALGRLTSTALQYGVPVETIIKQLDGITCCPVWHDKRQIKSLADGIGYILKLTNGIDVHTNGHSSDNHGAVSGLRCPECTGELSQSEGCATCMECGYSKCG